MNLFEKMFYFLLYVYAFYGCLYIFRRYINKRAGR